MDEQVGWRALARAARLEAPGWAKTLPELPRLVHRALSEDRLGGLARALERLAEENARRNRLLAALLALLAAGLAVLAAGLF
jgi:ubiquinone biosynthesis protein